jgi:hypothetical protein
MFLLTRGYNKQISLKVQRLIHDLRLPLKLLSKFDIKLLLKLLLDKKNTYKNTRKLLVNSLVNDIANTCKFKDKLVHCKVHFGNLHVTACRFILSNKSKKEEGL